MWPMHTLICFSHPSSHTVSSFLYKTAISLCPLCSLLGHVFSLTPAFYARLFSALNHHLRLHFLQGFSSYSYRLRVLVQCITPLPFLMATPHSLANSSRHPSSPGIWDVHRLGFSSGLSKLFYAQPAAYAPSLLCSTVFLSTASEIPEELEAEGGSHFRNGDLEVGGPRVSAPRRPFLRFRRLWTATLRRCRTWGGSLQRTCCS